MLRSVKNPYLPVKTTPLPARWRVLLPTLLLALLPFRPWATPPLLRNTPSVGGQFKIVNESDQRVQIAFEANPDNCFTDGKIPGGTYWLDPLQATPLFHYEVRHGLVANSCSDAFIRFDVRNTAGTTMAFFSVKMIVLPKASLLDQTLPLFSHFDYQQDSSVPGVFGASELYNEFSDGNEKGDILGQKKDWGLGVFHLVKNLDYADWMRNSGLVASGKGLNQIALPGSHDAGMHRVRADVIGETFGVKANTVTQWRTILEQLHAGIRYFDCRVVGQDLNRDDVPLRFAHFSESGGYCSAKEALGSTSDDLEPVLEELRNFLDTHTELVVLHFEHVCENRDQLDRLVSLIRSTLGDRLVTTPNALKNGVPIRQFFDSNPDGTLVPKGKVLVWFDLSSWYDPIRDPTGAEPYRGIYCKPKYNGAGGLEVDHPYTGRLYNNYTGKSSYSEMMADQQEKLLAYTPVYHDLSLLSWTLTHEGIEASNAAGGGFRSILGMAKQANNRLSENLYALRNYTAEPFSYTSPDNTALVGYKPNILYTDDCWEFLTAIAMVVNSQRCPPISFVSQPGVSTRSVCQYQPLELKAEVTPTSDKLTYEWHRQTGTDDVIVGTAATLTIAEAQPGDAGRYVLRVHNDCLPDRVIETNPVLVSVTPIRFGGAASVPAGVARCAGYRVPVSIDRSECPFPAGNVLTAELSDGNGSFDTPVSLGEIALGTTDVVLPVELSTGARYRIRVTSSKPALLSEPSEAFGVKALRFEGPARVPERSVRCADQTIDLTFSVGDNCAFPMGNDFIAELSDPNGSFEAPVRLGKVVPGSNAVPLPANTETGTGYRLRVVSTYPARVSEPSGVVRVKGLYLTSTPTVGGGPVCAGTPVRVSFTATTECAFPAANAFQAELSDAEGRFETGVTGLGEITPGSTTVLIPFATPAGTYRIRVRSSDPERVTAGSAALVVKAPTFASVPTVSGVPACPGGVIRVAFTQACVFPPDNVFTVQLSDASGGFDPAQTLGTVSPGLASLTLPAPLPPGTGYRVRLRSSNPALTSAQSAAFRVNGCGLTRQRAEPEAASGGLFLHASPNPTPEGRLLIQVSGLTERTLTLELYGAEGVRYHQQVLETEGEALDLTWNLSQQPAGLYLLRATSGRVSKTLKIIR